MITCMGYRGEVMFKYRNDNYIKVEEKDKFLFKKGVLGFTNEPEIGDRIVQLLILPYPQIELIEAEELSSTERGEGSYGSSGK